MQNCVIVCTDDICPSTVKTSWRYWEIIKTELPNLKLNAFVVPHRNFDNQELVTNQEFKDWYSSVKNWVALHLHGYAHDYPPEGLHSYTAQKHLLKSGHRLLRELTQSKLGYKAPGYLMNRYTVEILKELQFKFISYFSKISFFGQNEFLYSQKEVDIYQTHTNRDSTESIETQYIELLRELIDKKFLFISELIK